MKALVNEALNKDYLNPYNPNEVLYAMDLLVYDLPGFIAVDAWVEGKDYSYIRLFTNDKLAKRYLRQIDEVVWGELHFVKEREYEENDTLYIVYRRKTE